MTSFGFRKIEMRGHVDARERLVDELLNLIGVALDRSDRADILGPGLRKTVEAERLAELFPEPRRLALPRRAIGRMFDRRERFADAFLKRIEHEPLGALAMERDAESEIAVTEMGRVAVPRRAAHVRRLVAPPAAAHGVALRRSEITGIGRGPFRIGAVARCSVFPDVPEHVVEP